MKKCYIWGLICLFLLSSAITIQSSDCPSSFIISTTQLPFATVGMPYKEQLQSSGGQGSVRWMGDLLPQGLFLSKEGSISGTPITAGTTNLIVSASDCCPAGARNAVRTIPFTVTAGKGNGVIQKDSIGQKLSGVAFRKLNLIGKRFTYSDLRNADFTEAKIQDADFRDTDLTGANFSGAFLQNVNFTHNKLDKVSFYYTTFQNVRFSSNSMQNTIIVSQYGWPTQLDLSYQELSGAIIKIVWNITSLNFNFADLTGAQISTEGLKNTIMSFDGAVLSNSNLSNANFSNASFINANLLGANLTGTKFYRADMQGAKINKKWTQLIGQAQVLHIDKIIWVE